MVTQKIICAGFGGQGILSMGELLAYAGMLENREVSWLPSYGPEMRGGTANCHVIISETPIGSPIITEATAVIAMNLPSLSKFENYLVKDGLLLINSTLIKKKAERMDIRTFSLPANDLAIELGKDEVANMLMLGALIELSGVVRFESIIAAFDKVFEHIDNSLLVKDREALYKGAEVVRNNK